MSYIEKRKFDLRELVLLRSQPKIVVIVEPDYYLGALYKKYIIAGNMEVHSMRDMDGIHHVLDQTQAHVMLINPQVRDNPKMFVNALFEIKNKFPNLILVTIDAVTDSVALKKYMDAGISSHINRTFTRPQDVVIIINNLLQS